MSEPNLSEKMFVECITSLVSNCVEKMISSAKDVVKDQIQKLKIDMNFAFRDFVQKTYDKYSKIKTILYKDAPQPLYDFFVCPDLLYEKRLIDAQDIDNVLRVLPNSHYYIIQGSGGIGKSTLLKHFVLNELFKHDLMPVLIELKDFNRSDESIENCIFDYLLRMGVHLKHEYIEYALKTGCFLFLLDGYDELNDTKQGTFFGELNKICDKYDKNYFIISTRPVGDEPLIAFQRFIILKTNPFSKEKAISMMEKISFDKTIKDKFLKQLDAELYEKHISFASNPLLLTIMLLTYDQYAEIPEKKHIFYSNAFETLYSKHDATKGGYKREMKTNLTQDVFRRTLSEVCFTSYLKSQYEFTQNELRGIIKKACDNNKLDLDVDDYIRDLCISVCILYLDGRNYKFLHRSFQEYFTACYIKDMPEETMKLVTMHFIENSRRSTDQVLDMLYDMNQIVFERNVIIPILEEQEKNFNSKEDQFTNYLRRFVKGVGINEKKEQNGGLRLSLAIVMSMPNHISDFMFHFMLHYGNTYWIKNNEGAESQFMECLQKTMKKGVGLNEYPIDGIIKDEQLLSLIKGTWLGAYTTSLVHLLPELKEKVAKQKSDILSLLNL